MLIDRQMQSDFMLKLHRCILEVDHPPPADFPRADLSIAMVKATVNLYKNRGSKNEKKSYLSLI